MKTFDDIEKIFFREKLYYWSLRNSKGKGISRTSNEVIALVDEKARLQKAFEELEDVINDEEDGVYTIAIMPHQQGGKSKLEYQFRIGEVEEQPRRSRDNGGNNGNARTAGIGNLNSIGGFEFIAGLMDRGRGEVDRLRDENTNLKMELLEKKFKIGTLESEAAAGSGTETWSDVIKGIAKEYFPDILDRFAPEIDTERPSVIATLREREAVKAKVKREQKSVDTDGAAVDGDPKADNQPPKMDKEEAQARLRVIFERTQKAFPNHNPIEVWETILDMSEGAQGAFVKQMVVKVLDKK